jgi:hypothetical protein
MLIMVGLMGLALRVVGLTREPFWLDEAITWQQSSGSFPEVLLASAKEVHPPGYYLGVSVWRGFFGDTPAAFRSYSVLWSVLGLMAVVILARSMAPNRSWAAVAGLVLAVSPLDIYYAQEARSYSQLAALGVVGTTILWMWIKGEDRGFSSKRPLWAIGYAVTAASIMYTHYLGVFLLVAHASGVLVWAGMRRRGRFVGWYTASAATSILLYLPWILFHLRVSTRFFRPSYVSWIPTPELSEAVSFVWLDFFRTGMSPAWLTAAAWMVAALLVAVAVALILGLLRGRLEPPPVAASLWMLFVPPALAVAFSDFWHPVYFRHRFAVVVLPYFAVLFAVVCRGLPRRSEAVALAAVAMVVMFASSTHQYESVVKRGMSEFAELYRRQGPPDLVAFFPRNLTGVASYYCQHDFSFPSAKSITALSRRPGARAWVVTEPGFASRVSDRQMKRRQRILRLGRSQSIGRTDGLLVMEVVVDGDEMAHPSDR